MEESQKSFTFVLLNNNQSTLATNTGEEILLESLDKLSTEELVNLCKERNLQHTGSREIVIQRLREYIKLGQQLKTFCTLNFDNYENPDFVVQLFVEPSEKKESREEVFGTEAQIDEIKQGGSTEGNVVKEAKNEKLHVFVDTDVLFGMIDEAFTENQVSENIKKIQETSVCVAKKLLNDENLDHFENPNDLIDVLGNVMKLCMLKATGMSEDTQFKSRKFNEKNIMLAYDASRLKTLVTCKLREAQNITALYEMAFGYCRLSDIIEDLREDEPTSITSRMIILHGEKLYNISSTASICRTNRDGKEIWQVQEGARVICSEYTIIEEDSKFKLLKDIIENDSSIF